MRRIISEPQMLGVNVESHARLDSHRQIIQRKRMIREVFAEFHHIMMNIDIANFGDTAGVRIELGAGVYPIRESYPDVIATDIVTDPHLDRVLDAQAMDLPSQSVRALFGQNCFHHFPDPETFFREARRVIKPGGGIVLIDPYYGPVSSIVYKRLFTTETFDKAAPTWNALSFDPQAKPNQALSYVVFVRDKAKFLSKFPEFEVLLLRPLPSYLRYVLSGGLNFRQLAPDSFIPMLKTMEKLMRPLAPLLALHHVIALRRN